MGCRHMGVLLVLHMAVLLALHMGVQWALHMGVRLVSDSMFLVLCCIEAVEGHSMVTEYSVADTDKVV